MVYLNIDIIVWFVYMVWINLRVIFILNFVLWAEEIGLGSYYYEQEKHRKNR